jgi:hypothetical protein
VIEYAYATIEYILACYVSYIIVMLESLKLLLVNDTAAHYSHQVLIGFVFFLISACGFCLVVSFGECW